MQMKLLNSKTYYENCERIVAVESEWSIWLYRVPFVFLGRQ